MNRGMPLIPKPEVSHTLFPMTQFNFELLIGRHVTPIGLSIAAFLRSYPTDEAKRYLPRTDRFMILPAMCLDCCDVEIRA